MRAGLVFAVLIVSCRGAPAAEPRDTPHPPGLGAAYDECRKTAPMGNACMNAGAEPLLSPSLVALVLKCREEERDIGACLELANRYRTGVDVPLDHVRAFEYASVACGRDPLAIPRAYWGACRQYAIPGF